ncbi:MAG: S24 family peptidase [Candidatus Fimadaptatus sp.]
MSRLGDNIKKARLEKKMTPKQLGKKCGLSESVILDVEAGTRILSDVQARTISKVLGISDMESTSAFGMELDAATAAMAAPARPPKPYKYEPVKPIVPGKPQKEEDKAPSDAWLDALGGVMKRVPIMDESGIVIEHRMLPVIGGKIEGGQPDKVFYYRCPDDSMRGFRLQAGDLLLTIPQATPVDDAIMVIEQNGVRVARKIKRLEGNRVMLQSFDREFKSQTVGNHDVAFIGKCVRMEVML